MPIDERVKRINELAKKSKECGLDENERIEQQKLRQEYIKGFRNSLQSTLDHVVIVDEEGNKRKLNKKEN